MTDHKAEAEGLLEYALKAETGSEIEQSRQCQALVHATLFLGDQQRIANLIAVGATNIKHLNTGASSRDGAASDAAFEVARIESIFNQVREGLGL